MNLAALAERLGSLPPPLRKRALIRSLKFLRWILIKNGFDAYIPKEATRDVHMDLHIAARSKEEAARIAQKLVHLWGLKIKKKHANGTHLLFMPHLVAVVVNPKRN